MGTPQRVGELAADLTYVEAAFTSLARQLTRKALVVGKSTVPAGTAVRMEQLLRELAPCPDVELAWNPEFLREGFVVQDSLRPDRLVIGVHSEWAEFRSMHPGVVGKLVAQRKLVDGRNVLDPVQWRAAGWQYRALGRP